MACAPKCPRGVGGASFTARGVVQAAHVVLSNSQRSITFADERAESGGFPIMFLIFHILSLEQIVEDSATQKAPLIFQFYW